MKKKLIILLTLITAFATIDVKTTYAMDDPEEEIEMASPGDAPEGKGKTASKKKETPKDPEKLAKAQEKDDRAISKLKLEIKKNYDSIYKTYEAFRTSFPESATRGSTLEAIKECMDKADEAKTLQEVQDLAATAKRLKKEVETFISDQKKSPPTDAESTKILKELGQFLEQEATGKKAVKQVEKEKKQVEKSQAKAQKQFLSRETRAVKALSKKIEKDVGFAKLEEIKSGRFGLTGVKGIIRDANTNLSLLALTPKSLADLKVFSSQGIDIAFSGLESQKEKIKKGLEEVDKAESYVGKAKEKLEEQKEQLLTQIAELSEREKAETNITARNEIVQQREKVSVEAKAVDVTLGKLSDIETTFKDYRPRLTDLQAKITTKITDLEPMKYVINANRIVRETNHAINNTRKTIATSTQTIEILKTERNDIIPEMINFLMESDPNMQRNGAEKLKGATTARQAKLVAEGAGFGTLALGAIVGTFVLPLLGVHILITSGIVGLIGSGKLLYDIGSKGVALLPEGEKILRGFIINATSTFIAILKKQINELKKFDNALQKNTQKLSIKMEELRKINEKIPDAQTEPKALIEEAIASAKTELATIKTTREDAIKGEITLLQKLIVQAEKHTFIEPFAVPAIKLRVKDVISKENLLKPSDALTDGIRKRLRAGSGFPFPQPEGTVLTAQQKQNKDLFEKRKDAYLENFLRLNSLIIQIKATLLESAAKMEILALIIDKLVEPSTTEGIGQVVDVGFGPMAGPIYEDKPRAESLQKFWKDLQREFRTEFKAAKVKLVTEKPEINALITQFEQLIGIPLVQAPGAPQQGGAQLPGAPQQQVQGGQNIPQAQPARPVPAAPTSTGSQALYNLLRTVLPNPANPNVRGLALDDPRAFHVVVVNRILPLLVHLDGTVTPPEKISLLHSIIKMVILAFSDQNANINQNFADSDLSTRAIKLLLPSLQYSFPEQFDTMLTTYFNVPGERKLISDLYELVGEKLLSLEGCKVMQKLRSMNTLNDFTQQNVDFILTLGAPNGDFAALYEPERKFIALQIIKHLFPGAKEGMIGHAYSVIHHMFPSLDLTPIQARKHVNFDHIKRLIARTSNNGLEPDFETLRASLTPMQLLQVCLLKHQFRIPIHLPENVGQGLVPAIIPFIMSNKSATSIGKIAYENYQNPPPDPIQAIVTNYSNIDNNIIDHFTAGTITDGDRILLASSLWSYVVELIADRDQNSFADENIGLGDPTVNNTVSAFVAEAIGNTIFLTVPVPQPHVHYKDLFKTLTGKQVLAFCLLYFGTQANAQDRLQNQPTRILLNKIRTATKITDLTTAPAQVPGVPVVPPQDDLTTLNTIISNEFINNAIAANPQNPADFKTIFLLCGILRHLSEITYDPATQAWNVGDRLQGLRTIFTTLTAGNGPGYLNYITGQQIGDGLLTRSQQIKINNLFKVVFGQDYQGAGVKE